MKLYYVVNARMPNEKAHGIQIAKMCEAFAEVGADITLIVPTRDGSARDLQSFYSLRQNIPLIRLWVPDFYTFGRIGFFVSSVFFMLRYVLFLLRKRIMGEDFFIYTIDMDTFSFAFLPLLGACSAEMHTPKKGTMLQKFFFNRVHSVVSTNSLTKMALVQTFAFPQERIIVEPNGVDTKMFISLPSRDEARRKLLLPLTEKIALYVGRLYAWKGLEILPAAGERLLAEDIECYVVGGTADEFEKLSGQKLPKNLHCMGIKGVEEIPLWLAASDVALVVGTAHNIDSFRYTSPMKLFEYVAARVPIVASGTPALKDVLTENEVLFYEPDNAGSLARRIVSAVEDFHESAIRVEQAFQKVQQHTWQKRAERVLAFCSPLRENTLHATR